MNKIKDTDDYLVNRETTCALGTLKDTKGYQKVTINIQYLKQALKLFEEFIFEGDEITILVKNNGIMQIGKPKMGMLIAPIVHDNIETN